MVGKVYGYEGKQLRIDLTHKLIKIEEMDIEENKKYLGGVGLAAKILFEELPKGVDPLSSQNKIIFTTGPLTGTQAPGSGSVSLCFK